MAIIVCMSPCPLFFGQVIKLRNQQQLRIPWLRRRRKALISWFAGLVRGEKGDHWTSKYPYKDLAPQTEAFVDEPSASEPMANRSSAYVPLGMRGGAEKTGTEMRRRNEENSVRVTNLSEDYP